MESRRPVLRTGTEPKDPSMVRFVCLSDTHNMTDGLQVPSGDVLLHCGDFSKRGTPEQVRHFAAFLASLHFREKVVIAGNHDTTFDTVHFTKLKEDFALDEDIESEATKALLEGCTYLEDSCTQAMGYKVWGSPWQPAYCEMAFNLPIGPEIAEKWSKIANDTDILMTHGPPALILDTNRSGESTGCPLLRARIREIRPLVHVFGHIHEAYGVKEQEGTLFLNAATCTRTYQPVNPPIVFDLPLIS